MVKVTNLKIEELTFSKLIKAQDEQGKALMECQKLVPDLLEVLPKGAKYRVSFELHETNVDLANAIRRCLINEVYVKSLEYDENDQVDEKGNGTVEITDPYVLSDFLKKQIQLIPINQDVDYESYDISLYVENKTTEIVDVTTANFVISKKSKSISVTEIMEDNIWLCRLRPLEKIHIKKMTIVTGIGRQDAASFSPTSNVTYRILDHDYNEEKNISSLMANPTKFFIRYATHRNTREPLGIMSSLCDSLLERFNRIRTDLEKIPPKENSYNSDLLTLETNGNIRSLMINGENWTVSNLIARMCYVLTDTNIKLVTPYNKHHEKEMVGVKLIHPEFLKLLINACKKAADEITEVKKSFSKK